MKVSGQLHDSGKEAPWDPLGCFQSRSGCFREDENIFSLQGIKGRFVDPPSHSLVAY